MQTLKEFRSKKYRAIKKVAKRKIPLLELVRRKKKANNTPPYPINRLKKLTPTPLEKPSQIQSSRSQKPIRKIEQQNPSVKKMVFVDTYELPSTYNTTTISLIARDPRWMHAYWQLAPSSIETIRDKIGDELNHSSLVLRIYDVTYKIFTGTNANYSFDIDIDFHTNNWYIDLWNDNANYCCDLGIRTPDGKFFTLARSNYAASPRAHSSSRSDIIWMDVKDNEAKRPFVFVEIQKRRSRHTKNSWTTISKRKIYLSEDDVRAYYSKLFPLLRKIISARLAREVILKKLLGTHRYRFSLEEHALLSSILQGKLFKKIKIGASEEMILFGGASESIFSGASEKADKNVSSSLQ